MKFGFRDIFIFTLGFFSGTYLIAVKTLNMSAEIWSSVGIMVSLVFAFAFSNKSHEEKEMVKQLKNARKIHGK